MLLSYQNFGLPAVGFFESLCRLEAVAEDVVEKVEVVVVVRSMDE